MKLVIAGSRSLKITSEFIGELVNHFRLEPTEIVYGGAEGIDTSAKTYSLSVYLPTKLFLPEYDKYYENPRYAPIARNGQMAEYGDALLLIWDGKSKGSANMRSQMYSKDKPVYEVILKTLID